MSQVKFPDCVSCRYFIRKTRRNNPICGSCDNGEFYEERSRNRELSDNELMNMFGRMHRDD
ncbi:hypothetical protein [Mesorhizobium sp.]|uniref:hypothetical protein n=1 Tax=Mesorhizobium sp. TaxID=1871066 RepID=UPI000FE36208|nr:hypothetical protein [Mesorhizobium sp.]RWB95553.1 MAG: hypothetical protein EOQ56_27785 [Mesorhizobium sp.]RWJ03504.1 MAG: hypothetical protein EOR24_32510 [Mesorhizobium sp.]